MEQKESILEDISITETEAPLGKRLLTNIIDFAIEIAIIVGFYFFMPRDIIVGLMEGRSYMKYVIAFIIIFAYRLLCILGAGKTFGMALCKVKYLNKNQQPLSTAEKITVVFINRTGIKYYNA